MSSDGGYELLRNRRILIAIGPLVLGGAERQALLLARILRSEYGADVEIWSIYERSRQLVPHLEGSGVPWRIVHGPVVGAQAPLLYRARQVVRFFRFSRALREASFDVLLPFMTEPGTVVSLARRFAELSGRRSVCIWNERADGTEARSARLRRAMRLALRFTDASIANSEIGARFLRETMKVSGARVHVIRNGVQLAAPGRGRAAWRDELGARDGDIVATMVGNLHPPKDQATLVRAWRRVADALEPTGRRCILALAGRFVATHDELRALADELGVAHLVRFLGAVDDVSGLLHASDLGVFSSTSEGTPNGVLECMAAGLPVVASDLPGIRDALGPDAGDLLFPVGDDERAAREIVALIGDAGRMERIGAANRARVEEHYGPHRMAAHFADVIVETLSRPKEKQ